MRRQPHQGKPGLSGSWGVSVSTSAHDEPPGNPSAPPSPQYPLPWGDSQLCLKPGSTGGCPSRMDHILEARAVGLSSPDRTSTFCWFGLDTAVASLGDNDVTGLHTQVKSRREEPCSHRQSLPACMGKASAPGRQCKCGACK